MAGLSRANVLAHLRELAADARYANRIRTPALQTIAGLIEGGHVGSSIPSNDVGALLKMLQDILKSTKAVPRLLAAARCLIRLADQLDTTTTANQTALEAALSILNDAKAANLNVSRFNARKAGRRAEVALLQLARQIEDYEQAFAAETAPLPSSAHGVVEQDTPPH